MEHPAIAPNQGTKGAKGMVCKWKIKPFIVFYSDPHMDRNGLQYMFSGDLLFYLF